MSSSKLCDSIHHMQLCYTVVWKKIHCQKFFVAGMAQQKLNTKDTFTLNTIDWDIFMLLKFHIRKFRVKVILFVRSK